MNHLTPFSYTLTPFLRWGLERAEHFGGGQWAEPRALRSAGVGSHDSFKANLLELHVSAGLAVIL